MTEKKLYKLRDSNNREYLSEEKGLYGGNKSLKIVGELDCKSANLWIKKGKYVKNRVFFKDLITAYEAGYRPCGVCMKKEYLKWKEVGADKWLDFVHKREKEKTAKILLTQVKSNSR